MGERPVQKCACEADCAWCVGANDPMTAHELADALDAHAARNVPGENTAFVRVNVTLLSDAAQRLRELEAVRVAARESDIARGFSGQGCDCESAILSLLDAAPAAEVSDG